MRAMIVDIGSNTVKYDVFDIEGKSFTNIEHLARALGFISYINDSGIPSDEGVAKLCGILQGYKQRACEIECDEILVFATASLRRCRDPYEVICRIYENTGLETVLFDGETEAEMSLLGVLATDSDTFDGIMADMGGGSTELNIYRNRKSVYLISNPFGALSLKNAFVRDKGGVTGEFASFCEIEKIYEYVRLTVGNADVPDPMCETMFIVGGSARAIGALAGYHMGNSTEFTVEDLDFLIKEYVPVTEEKAELLRSLVPTRELIIIPAIAAFRAIARVLGIKRIKVATGGIREGYMYSRFIGRDL